MTAPLLTATASGDILELRPGGSWTAANAATLEQLSDGIASQLDRSATIRLDMAGVSELDTLGEAVVIHDLLPGEMAAVGFQP